MNHSKICQTCKIEFFSNRSHKNFCSRLCYRRDPVNKQKYSDRVKAYQKLHSKEPLRRFEKLKHKCNSEKRQLNISNIDYVNLISQPCVYCNKSLLDETGCGLDRLDNNKDYLLNNVVPCCGTCNQIRNNHLTHEEMKVAMKAIQEYRGSL